MKLTDKRELPTCSEIVRKNQGLSDEQYKSYKDNAAMIFRRMPNQENNLKKTNGLVYGKVQSGKTGNIITTAAYALDCGYKLIIMFLGSSKNLLEQNYRRVNAAFENCSNILVINKQDERMDFQFKDSVDTMYQDKKIIICTLKNFAHLDQIQNAFKNSKYFQDYVAIFDDEGDEISLNTCTKKFIKENNLVSEEVFRSRNNKSITELRDNLKYCAYLSVTATPEANVLLQPFQNLSLDYVVTLKEGPFYKGLVSFHDGNEHIEVINDFTKEELEEDSFCMPKSLYDAFYYFIATCICRAHNEDEEDITNCMLIHPAKKIATHKMIYDSFTKYLNLIKKFFEQGKECQSAVDIANAIIEKYNEIPRHKETNFDEINFVLNHLMIHCINGKQDTNNLKEKLRKTNFHIIIGADMLNRGITIDGLSVSYFTRDSDKGQIDTLLQRARWFGYRQKYFYLCKVYLTQKLVNQFSHIIETEESLIEQLEYYSKFDNVTGFDVQLPIKNDLKPTSLQKALFESKTGSKTINQHYFCRDKGYNNHNIELLKEYRQRSGETKRYNENQVHKLVKITLKELKFIINNYDFVEPEGKSIRENFELVIKTKDLKDNDCVDMLFLRTEGKLQESRSTINENTTGFDNVMQGHSQDKSPSDKDYYPGDRNCLKSNNIILQVHYIALKNDVGNYKKTDIVSILSIIMPDSYVFGTFVGRKNIQTSAD